MKQNKLIGILMKIATILCIMLFNIIIIMQMFKVQNTHVERNEVLWVKYGTYKSGETGGIFSTGSISEKPCYYINIVKDEKEFISSFDASKINISRDVKEDEKPYIEITKDVLLPVKSKVEVHVYPSSKFEEY